MALPYYVTITGASTGLIEGSNQKVGHEKEIQGHALEQRYYRAYDQQTGVVKGQRINGPFKITKSFDKSSPLLYQVLKNGEKLEVVMKFFRVDQDSGAEVNYYTITLRNATIVEIKPHMLNHLDENLARFDHMEDILVTYKDCEWKWVPDGISFEDAGGA